MSRRPPVTLPGRRYNGLRPHRPRHYRRRAREAAVRIVFFLSHGLYLQRQHGDLVRALAAAGHDIVLAKTSPKEVDESLFDDIALDVPGVRTAVAPPRAGAWWATNDAVRALRDYLRYLGPAYADAPTLFARAARRIPRPLRTVLEGRVGALPSARRVLDAALRLLERATPPDPALLAWLEAQAPDAVLLTPLTDFDYVQLDALKAALSLGIPTAHLVTSWDDLASKGGILLPPDRVLVWNDRQKQEARSLHGIPPDRVIVTGAQLFDHWFDRAPLTTRAVFCSRAGSLDPARPLLLYLCSSSFICAYEVGIVRRWIAALREADDPLVRSANVLVRPHPFHARQWADVDLSHLGNVAIWPRGGEVPMDAARKQACFDSLHHAAAVVGINTSGFLEAAIVGRRTLVLNTPETMPTQKGTLHFRYLLEGGLLLSAGDLPEHFAQLGRVLRGLDAAREPLRRFVADFLRPHGIAEPALPRVLAAVEQLARLGRRRRAPSRWRTWPVRVAAAPPRPANVLRVLEKRP
jgi:hypothetical protein